MSIYRIFIPDCRYSHFHVIEKPTYFFNMKLSKKLVTLLILSFLSFRQCHFDQFNNGQTDLPQVKITVDGKLTNSKKELAKIKYIELVDNPYSEKIEAATIPAGNLRFTNVILPHDYTIQLRFILHEGPPRHSERITIHKIQDHFYSIQDTKCIF